MAPAFSNVGTACCRDLMAQHGRRSCWLSSLVLSVLALTGSVASSSADDEGTTTDFTTVIQPLFESKCWSCHGQNLRKGDLDLRTPTEILKGGESGAVIVPGKPDESLLYTKVFEREMPPKKKNQPLTDLEVESIRKWIQSGASFGTELASTKPAITQHHVLPILMLRCVVCHGTRKQEGGLDLRTRASMIRGGKSGPAMVPGKPEQSLILCRVHDEEMPPRKSLTEAMVKPMEADEVDTLKRWIELGAPEAADEPDRVGSASEGLVTKEDRAFWSFQPPRPASLPNTAHADRVRNPIDAFILQKLEAKGLSLSPAADRLTLLRRASFDLTGLPPTPSEAEAFLANDAPDSYEQLIERLLASPGYGERWGRHWLDVAGYADCEGRREQHLPRPEAWRYRDYVIRSFNSDKPYDRFLCEQLAGDELADYEHAPEITQDIEDDLVATAFLRMAPDPTWANLTGFVPDRLEVMADALDVLGSGVMGLTFKCARCHTHKFDPIPQRDYYRLIAIFKGAYDENDWLKPELNAYGGAVSAGLGQRYLPYVTTAERSRWEQANARVQRELEKLKAASASPESANQIKKLEATRPPQPRLMALWDRGEPSPTYLYRRGNYLTPGPLIEPGLPAALDSPDRPFEPKPPWPGAKSTGRRLAFARWLTQPDHPLTARVMVNRIWKHHFGRGIVASLGNFGKMGDRPSHPELLDWLACEFVRQGWSMKAMHRLIMTSDTYRQASAVTDQHQRLDPSNQLWSRMPMRRMAAEELRDSLLAVAGQLNPARYGPAEPVTVRGDGLVLSGKRRSVYVQQLRKEPPSLLESFDLPAMNPNCLQRSESLVAPQALHLLNDSAIREMAGQFACRVLQSADANAMAQVREIYALALCRSPSDEELEACLDFLHALRASAVTAGSLDDPGKDGDREAKALAALCHSVMNSAAFLYID